MAAIKKRVIIKIVILLFVYASMVYFVLGALFTGKAMGNIHGFAVNEEGIVYIGTDDGIVCYSGDTVVKRIDLPLSRSYAFTIKDGGYILCTDGEMSFLVSENGDVAFKTETDAYSQFVSLGGLKPRGNTKYTGKDGIHYFSRNQWGRMFIYSESGAVVYKMPFLSYFVRILGLLIFETFPVSAIALFVPELRRAEKVKASARAMQYLQ